MARQKVPPKRPMNADHAARKQNIQNLHFKMTDKIANFQGNIHPNHVCE